MLMFQYVAMTNAATVAARYAANHGATCSQTPNSCSIKVQDVANLIASTARILDPARLNVSLTDNSGTTTCTLSVCETKTAQFPSSTGQANAVGNPITINLTYAITNPMPMYWTAGAQANNSGYALGARSIQVIQF